MYAILYLNRLNPGVQIDKFIKFIIDQHVYFYHIYQIPFILISIGLVT